MDSPTDDNNATPPGARATEAGAVPQAQAPAQASVRARSQPLDALRAAAILIVLGYHMRMYNRPWGLPAPLMAIVRVWERAGWMGVDLFFVLSGFLVAGLLFREYRERAAIGVLRFYARRGFKIYPSFYLFLAVSFAFAAASGTLETRWVVAEVLFVQSYFPSLWTHTWSLAVEEHFYFLLPLALLVFARVGRSKGDPFTRLPAAIAIVAVLVLALRSANAALRPYTDLTHLWPTHLRIDALFFGVLLAYFHHFHRERLGQAVARWRAALAIAALALLAPVLVLDVRTSLWMQTFGLTSVYLGCGAALLLVLRLRPPRHPIGARALAALALIGRDSYSIYLWHLGVVRFALVPLHDHYGPDRSYVACVLLYTASTIGVGLIMARLIETPFLRLRDRLVPRHSGGALGNTAIGEQK